MKPVQKKSSLIRVLLLEDESKVAQLIRLHLQSRGFTVDIAEDGEHGLEIASRREHDVLLVGQAMTGPSGLEFVRELKKRGPLPPTIMISGLGIDRTTVEALKLGVLDFVVKDPEGAFLQTLPAVIREGFTRAQELEVRERTVQERERWTEELQQRLREFGCLYGIEKLLSDGGARIDIALQSVVDVIPGACRNSDGCWARIALPDRTFSSSHYTDTPWREEFELIEYGTPIGRLEVGFQTDPGQPLFSAAEQDLLRSAADRIGEFVDRWKTESRLTATHEELRRLFRAVEQSGSAVMITNSEGEMEYVNPKFTEMTGYRKDEALGKTPRILKAGEKGPEEYAELWRILKAGREWKGEFHNKKKDGALYWDYSTISPITNPQGEVTHFVAVKEDITDNKETEQLREGVLQLAARIAGCVTEDEICRVVVEGVRELMNVDRCGLFLGDCNAAVFRGSYGTDLQGKTTDEHFHFWNIRKERDVVDLFASAPYKTGFPLGAPEAMPGEENLCSTLIALRQSGSVFGIISIDNRISRRPVTENQMTHIALLAEVLGNALQVARAREALRKAAEETQGAYAELEAFNQAMVGRENRVIELKDEINRLLAERGEPPRYPPVWDNPGTVT